MSNNIIFSSNNRSNYIRVNGPNRIVFNREINTASSASRVTALFFSDFSTAVGTGSAARSDGSKWNLAANSVVVEANPGTLGFPSNMANVLRVPWYPYVGGLINRKGGIFGPPDASGILPIPSVGDTQYYRFYFRYDQPFWCYGRSNTSDSRWKYGWHVKL